MTTPVLDGSKLRYHPDRVAEFMAKGRLAKPITLDMALTQACQYRCQYCFAKFQANTPHKMSWATLKRLLKDAAHMGVRSIALQGDGESTLHPDFPAFVEKARELGMAVGLATNGYAYKPALAERTLRFLNWIQFNMSAGDPDEYAEVMGVPVRYFHQVTHNIRHVVGKKRQDRLGTTIYTQQVLMPKMAHLVAPYCKLARAMGVDHARIKHCSDNPNVEGGLGVDYALYNKAVRQSLKEAEAAHPKGFVQVKWSKINDGAKRSYDRCVGCQFLLQISGSGLVAPCGMLFEDRFKDYWLGSVIDTPLSELVGGPRWRQVMGLLDSPAFDPAKMCGTLCAQHDANKYIHDLRHPPPNAAFC